MTAAAPVLSEAAAAEEEPGLASGAAVARRSFDAARWVAVASVGNVTLSFGVFLVLARLIGPAEFGMVAIAAVFIDILQIVARCGLPDAVVQRADLDEDFAATAFWVMLATGALCAAGLAALSGPIAWIFDLPTLQPVLCALSACFVITAAGAIHEARLQRSFDSASSRCARSAPTSSAGPRPSSWPSTATASGASWCSGSSPRPRPRS